jgi:hypothetical protein
LLLTAKLSGWGADNGGDGETIVEDDAEREDRSGEDNGDGDDDGDSATQGLPIEDCNDRSSSEMLNHTVEVSYAK